MKIFEVVKFFYFIKSSLNTLLHQGGAEMKAVRDLINLAVGEAKLKILRLSFAFVQDNN